MVLNLVADKTLRGKIYPALARHEAWPYTPGWREFGEHWPHTIPIRLQEYCDHHGIALNIYSTTDLFPADALYPIGLAFFDFDIDYVELMPAMIRKALHQEKLRVLF
jgi:hypothetical protein